MEKVFNKSKVLPKCLCNIDLPHTSEHTKHLPPLVMPTITMLDAPLTDPNETRVKELMTDFNSARADNFQLEEKFEKKTRKLIDELKNIPDHCECKCMGTEIMVESGDRLKYQLEHSRFLLAEARNQLHSLSKELNMYRRLVRQEIGSDMTLHQLLNSKEWKGRAVEIARLKTEIANMESNAFSHKYLRNPLSIPKYNPRFPRVEDLIPRRQVEFLKKEAIKRKEEQSKKAKEVTTLMNEYGDLALMYKASVTHNKTLAEELRNLKEQLQTYDAKTKSDLELIKKLTIHEMQMKKMLDREAQLAKLVSMEQGGKIETEDNKELDSTKYKVLWETSEYQKQSFLEILQQLTSQLDKVMDRTEEAEKHCQQNQNRQEDVEHLIEERKAAEKAKPKKKQKKKGKKGKNDGSVSAQLKVVNEENEFLKTFLHSEIESREKDLELYLKTMNNIREQYLEALNKLTKKEEVTSPTVKGEQSQK